MTQIKARHGDSFLKNGMIGPLTKEECLAEAARYRESAARLRLRLLSLRDTTLRQSLLDAADSYDLLALSMDSEAARL